MGWSYRKRIKIIPGIHLNFSKSGISTSFGVKGASLNFNNKGVYLNTSIPGTGISYKQQFLNNTQPAFHSPINGTSHDLPIPSTYYYEHLHQENIFSLDPGEITSPGMQGVKEAILLAQKQRIDLANDLKITRQSLKHSKTKLVISYVFLYGLIKKTISQSIKEDILNQKNAIDQINEQIEQSAIALDYVFEDTILRKYHDVTNSFLKLSTSNKIWDVTSLHNQNRIVARSAASAVVNKQEVRLGIKSIPDIKSNFEPLYFKNANGADLYFYPHFIIMYSTNEKFAIIGLHEITFLFSPVRFVETGVVPSDSKKIDTTWAKVNKNGSPDRRFKDNYQIPIVRYGSIKLQTSTGLNEEYEFSNYESCEAFANAFITYQNTVKSLQPVYNN